MTIVRMVWGSWSNTPTRAGSPLGSSLGSKEKVLSAKQLAEEGFSVHAGADEQSQLLFLRPELVPENYRSAPSLTGANFADLVGMAKGEGWPGYFGAPRLATAALGALEFTRSSENLNATALQILDGLDFRKVPRFADEMDPLNVLGETAELKHEKVIEQRELDWLKKNKIE
jgi:hypothetical protein